MTQAKANFDEVEAQVGPIYESYLFAILGEKKVDYTLFIAKLKIIFSVLGWSEDEYVASYENLREQIIGKV